MDKRHESHPGSKKPVSKTVAVLALATALLASGCSNEGIDTNTKQLLVGTELSSPNPRLDPAALAREMTEAATNPDTAQASAQIAHITTALAGRVQGMLHGGQKKVVNANYHVTDLGGGHVVGEAWAWVDKPADVLLRYSQRTGGVPADNYTGNVGPVGGETYFTSVLLLGANDTDPDVRVETSDSNGQSGSYQGVSVLLPSQRRLVLTAKYPHKIAGWSAAEGGVQVIDGDGNTVSSTPEYLAGAVSTAATVVNDLTQPQG